MQHESLEEAIEAMIREAKAKGTPLTHIAELMGENYKKLERELNPFDEGAKLGANRLIPLMTACGSLLPLQYLAYRMEHRLIPYANRVPDKPTLAEECMDTYPAVTEFHAAMAEGLPPVQVGAKRDDAIREIEEDFVAYCKKLEETA